jgi:hypothetical protein
MQLTGVEISPEVHKAEAIVNGVAWVALSITILAASFTGGLNSVVFAVVGFIGDIGGWIIALALLGVLPRPISPIGGYLLIPLAVWFLYMGIAIYINMSFKRALLPIGGALFKEIKMEEKEN